MGHMPSLLYRYPGPTLFNIRKRRPEARKPLNYELPRRQEGKGKGLCQGQTAVATEVEEEEEVLEEEEGAANRIDIAPPLLERIKL